MNETTTTAAAPTRSRKRLVIVPLAGLLVAAAVAVGSGADFVSNSVNTANAFSTGTLAQQNSKADKAIFTASNLKPGDTLSGVVTITNSGSLPASFALTENAVNGFVKADNLTLTITRAGSATPVWSGTFGALTKAGPLDLGTFSAGEAREYTFSTTLAQGADNTEQGKSATATYTWDAKHGAAETVNQ
jgi:hypothetical protein